MAYSPGRSYREACSPRAPDSPFAGWLGRVVAQQRRVMQEQHALLLLLLP